MGFRVSREGMDLSIFGTGWSMLLLLDNKLTQGKVSAEPFITPISISSIKSVYIDMVENLRNGGNRRCTKQRQNGANTC
jgi:hypothetical protein